MRLEFSAQGRAPGRQAGEAGRVFVHSGPHHLATGWKSTPGQPSGGRPRGVPVRAAGHGQAWSLQFWAKVL